MVVMLLTGASVQLEDTSEPGGFASMEDCYARGALMVKDVVTRLPVIRVTVLCIQQEAASKGVNVN